MYLSASNSVIEGAGWLTQNTSEPWTWRNVLEMFSRMAPETITVINPIGQPLIRLFPPEAIKTSFRYPVPLQVCNVGDFLEQILRSDDFESACAYPLALVGLNARFRSSVPVRASAIRLSKFEIYQLAEFCTLDPFGKLVRETAEGKCPELAILAEVDPSDDYQVLTRVEALDQPPATCEKGRQVWDEKALRRLLIEQTEDGMTHEKLANRYRVSRQFIGNRLQKAKNLIGPRKANPFDALKFRKS